MARHTLNIFQYLCDLKISTLVKNIKKQINLFLFYLFIVIKHNQTKHTYMFQPNIPTCIKKYWGFKLVPFLFVHLFGQTTAQEAK